MDLLSINRETCNQDGICAAVCPSRIIDFQKGKFPSLVTGAEKSCIQCGHCVAVCPTGSLSHRDMEVKQCSPIQKNFQLSPVHCEHFLRSRRSIRVYKKKPVPREDITRLIEMARYAPSGRNSQDTEWLVLGNKNELHNIAGSVIDWMRWMIDSEPEIALSMHLARTIERWEKGVDIIFREAPVIIIAHADENNHRALTSCTIALTYLELAATSMGLGCCWAGYFKAAAAIFPPLIEMLRLPVEHQCFGAMMVGYPRFKYHRLPLRKSPAITWRVS